MNINITLSLQNTGDSCASNLRINNVKSVLASSEEIVFETIGDNGKTTIKLQGRKVLFTQATEHQ